MTLPREDAQPRGRLFFGATQGPASWREDRDGPWSGGYWVEAVGGAADGVTVVLSLDQIGPGLKEGDLCIIQELEEVVCAV
jgi:hypothetical protein